MDGSIPRTGGQDAMDLSGDYALHRVDDDFIDYVVPVKVSPHYSRSIMLPPCHLPIHRTTPPCSNRLSPS